MKFNYEDYEGTFCDLEEPGYYVVEKDDIDYIKISKLEVIEDTLLCEFEVVKSEFTNDEVQDLIFFPVLKIFCKDYYADNAKIIHFINKKTSEEWKTLYIS